MRPAPRSWPRTGAWLLTALRDLEAGSGGEPAIDVVIDLGRWGGRNEATQLMAGADAVALVLRSDFTSLSLGQGLRAVLPRRPDAALLVGERDPYSAREVARALDTEVAGVLPVDARAARRVHSDMADGGRTRSSLARAAAAAAGRLRALVAERSGV